MFAANSVAKNKWHGIQGGEKHNQNKCCLYLSALCHVFCIYLFFLHYFCWHLEARTPHCFSFRQFSILVTRREFFSRYFCFDLLLSSSLFLTKKTPEFGCQRQQNHLSQPTWIFRSFVAFAYIFICIFLGILLVRTVCCNVEAIFIWMKTKNKLVPMCFICISILRSTYQILSSDSWIVSWNENYRIQLHFRLLFAGIHVRFGSHKKQHATYMANMQGYSLLISVCIKLLCIFLLCCRSVLWKSYKLNQYK